VTALSQTRLSFTCIVPAQPGEYQLEASLLGRGARPVHSLRDFKVVP